MSFNQVVNNFLSGVLDPLVALIVGIAVVLFLWGLVGYLRSGLGDKAELQKAKSLMVWGVVVITVMVSVWGLVQVLQEMFFGSSGPGAPPEIPCFSGENCPSRTGQPATGGGFVERLGDLDVQ